MKRFFSVATLLFYTTAYGQECAKKVQYVRIDEPSPCTGYLFSPEMELEVRGINEDKKACEKKLEIQMQILNLQELKVKNLEEALKKESERAELWRDTSYKMAEDNIKKMEQSNVQSFVWLLGGVGLTVLSGWAIHLASE